MRTNPIEMLGQLQVHSTVYQMYKYCIVHNNIGDSSSLVLCVFGFLGAESLTWYWFSGLVGAGPEAPPTPSVRSRGEEMERRSACSGEFRPFPKSHFNRLSPTHTNITHKRPRTHTHTYCVLQVAALTSPVNHKENGRYWISSLHNGAGNIYLDKERAQLCRLILGTSACPHTRHLEQVCA